MCDSVGGFFLKMEYWLWRFFLFKIVLGVWDRFLKFKLLNMCKEKKKIC